ncbi:CHASE3 domain-containing protein [Methylovorus menthalis]|uniref:sensor histidine kinase n=1 Tax=Methylovorus menthalis TaxID=1002227 RepID=UPI001E4C8BA3|nr:sensor histidine kinase [Methylovorus menthalis]MCB4811040.1 CHASE3 domain-containing protein [Methylovorus menthalis]
MKPVIKQLLTSVGMGIAMLLLATIAYLSFTRTEHFVTSSRWVDHTYTVLIQLDKVTAGLKEAESSERGYLLTNDRHFFRLYEDVVRKLPADMQKLQALTSDNPTQQRQVLAFNARVQDKLDSIHAIISTKQENHRLATDPVFLGMLDTGKQIMQDIRTQAANILNTEQTLLRQRLKAMEDEAASTRQWILIGNLLAASMLGLSFWLLIKEIQSRERAQRKAEATASQLEITNRELESFSYSVSHDLRAPLRAIDGYSRMFEEDYSDKLDEEGLRLLSVVRSNSRKMGQLIDDLLQFARSGRKQIEAEPINMPTLIHEVWQEVTADQMAHNTALELQQLLTVHADRALIRQVLINLLSNAVKYSKNKPAPRVIVRSSHHRDMVSYEIEDNGVGFDMRYYNKLFGVFQRLHSADEFPGTGVGLAIVQRIIVRHGGQVWGKSTLGEGSVFGFSLPWKEPHHG